MPDFIVTFLAGGRSARLKDMVPKARRLVTGGGLEYAKWAGDAKWGCGAAESAGDTDYFGMR